MPTSTYSHLPAVVRFLHLTMPSSVLDIGVGNGKMGFVVRDYLDVMLGERHREEDWTVQLDGIEVFGEYIQEHQRAIYSHIYIGDAFEVIDALGVYDLVIVGDVLEHFGKQQAWMMLDKCAVHCSRDIILNIPLGEGWTQSEIYGNPYEAHRSFWRLDEFEPFVREREIFSFPGIGHYGCLLIGRAEYLNHRFRERVEMSADRGTLEEEIPSLRTIIKDLALDIRGDYTLIDCMLRKNLIAEAVASLEDVIRRYPEESAPRLYREKLLHHLTPA